MARAFIFFAYPNVISGDNVWIAEKADAYSGATPLALCNNGSFPTIDDNWSYFLGVIPGSMGETCKLAILFGAVLLIYTKMASFRIMFSVVLGGLSMGWIFNLIGTTSMMQIPAWQHLLMGGFLFGAVFMATDPVSAAHTKQGKVIYGFLIGVVAILIRVLNKGYVEGMMLAILLMNIFAPLIDYCVVQIHIKKREKRYLQFAKKGKNE